MPRSRLPLTVHTRRRFVYATAFIVLLLAPLFLRVPWLGPAVAQNSVLVLILVPMYFAAAIDPRARQWLVMLRDGVAAVAVAVCLLFAVISIHILSFDAAIPPPRELAPSIAGIAYILVSHVLAALAARRRVPDGPSATLTQL